MLKYKGNNKMDFLENAATPCFSNVVYDKGWWFKFSFSILSASLTAVLSDLLYPIVVMLEEQLLIEIDIYMETDRFGRN